MVYNMSAQRLIGPCTFTIFAHNRVATANSVARRGI